MGLLAQIGDRAPVLDICGISPMFTHSRYSTREFRLAQARIHLGLKHFKNVAEPLCHRVGCNGV